MNEIEKAAREYASKLAEKWCEEDNQPASYQHPYHGATEGFKAGHAYALSMASDGFDEYLNNFLPEVGSIDETMSRIELEKAILPHWQAACEYKQKEIDFFKDRNETHISKIARINQVNDGLHILLKEAEAENKKLREALEFYANEQNQIAPIYPHDGRNRPGADFTAPYRMDSGQRAREALKEVTTN
jgi:hypothetical protein